MATEIGFSGEIVHEGGKFVIKIELSFPTMEQCRDFGGSLNRWIEGQVTGRGGKLTKNDVVTKPHVLMS